MNQKQIEMLLHPKHILEDIKKEIEEFLSDDLKESMKLIFKWVNTSYWDSKNKRLDLLKDQDLYSLLLNIIAKTVLYCQEPMKLASVIGMVSIQGMSKIDSMTTVGELIAILVEHEYYELSQIQGTYYVTSSLEPSEQLAKRIHLGCYLPPMVEKPDVITTNKSSGYKTIYSDSLILSDKENYHDENICLDVLNILNSNEFELDNDFVLNHVKTWHREELSKEQLLELSLEERQQYEQDIDNWDKFQEQYKYLRSMLLGKTIYFTHKVDKRGRVYTQGYHFNPQGSSFEKACLNLKTKEIVTGEL